MALESARVSVQDPTMPVTDREKRQWVVRIIASMRDVQNAVDSNTSNKRWKSNMASQEELIDIRAWQLLVSHCPGLVVIV